MFDTPYHIVPIKKKLERSTEENYEICRSGERNPICTTDEYTYARLVVEALNEQEARKKAGKKAT